MSPDFKSTIDKLFDDDLFASAEKAAKENRSILPDLQPTLEESEKEALEEKPHRPASDGDGFERREFNRAEVLERKIEVKFRNQRQFAKQYIENISIGGLFVRTEETYEFGEVLPITFEVANRTFELTAKVCRIRDDGVGVEFTNISPQVRADLETFVQNCLPQGQDIKTKARQSTIDRLHDIREKQQKERKNRRKRYLQVAAIVSLLALNSFMLVEQSIETFQVRERVEPTIDIAGQTIELESIRSVTRNSDGEIFLNLQNDRRIPLTDDEANRALPMHLKQTYQLLRSTSPREKKRMSKTAPNQTRFR